MKKLFELSLGFRKVRLNIFQFSFHILLIVFAWMVFVFLVIRTIQIEEQHINKLIAIFVLVVVALLLGLTSFILYMKRKKIKKFTYADNSFNQEISYNKSMDSKKRLKYIEIDN